MSKEISRSALSSSVIVARISADPTMFDHPKRIKRRLALLFCIALASPLLAESPMRSNTVETTLRIPASRFSNSSLEQLPIDLRTGIGPDDAAAIALYSNPALRSIRDRRGLASAQLIQAGILPNPVVSYSRDYVTGGNTAGTVTAYNFTAAWEFSALIPFLPKQTAARKNYRSVDLDVAWDEWQIAVNARTAVYRALGLNAQLAQAVEATEGLQQSTDAMRKAVDAHEKTVLELAAVESASQDSRATMLALEQEFHKQGLGLNKILGVEAEVKVALRAGLSLPTRLAPPEQHELAEIAPSRSSWIATRTREPGRHCARGHPGPISENVSRLRESERHHERAHHWLHCRGGCSNFRSQPGRHRDRARHAPKTSRRVHSTRVRSAFRYRGRPSRYSFVRSTNYRCAGSAAASGKIG